MIISKMVKYDMESIIENQTGQRVDLTNEQVEDMCKVIGTLNRNEIIEYCKQLVK